MTTTSRRHLPISGGEGLDNRIQKPHSLAVRLSAQGHFTWKEWAAALADELKAAADRGEPDDGSRYYEHWLAALERLVTAKGLSNPAAMLERKEAWANAYRHTPHGKPVELAGSGVEHS